MILLKFCNDKGETCYARMAGKWVLRKKPDRFIRLPEPVRFILRPVEQRPKLKR